MQREKRKFLYDIILVLALLLVGISVFFIVELSRSEGVLVRVSINGETAAEYSLSDDGEYSLNGGTNILVISDGEAYISEASCPDGLCVNQGRVSRSGERIVCLPNRVIVEIVGGDSDFLER